jgi:hypothetical protein
MSTAIFGNGQALSNSAQTHQQIEATFQSLITNILGNTIPQDKQGSAVRISWPTSGAPGWDIEDDVAFLRATISDDAISLQRDKQWSPLDASDATETTTYIRVWRIDLSIYGPNSLDHARLIKSALFMDWVAVTLAPSKLAVLVPLQEPRRIPELFAGEWWERVDFSIQVNELVTETMTVNPITSVEITLSAAEGPSVTIDADA